MSTSNKMCILTCFAWSPFDLAAFVAWVGGGTGFECVVHPNNPPHSEILPNHQRMKRFDHLTVHIHFTNAEQIQQLFSRICCYHSIKRCFIFDTSKNNLLKNIDFYEKVYFLKNSRGNNDMCLLVVK